jgi:hypothetical protein
MAGVQGSRTKSAAPDLAWRSGSLNRGRSALRFRDQRLEIPGRHHAQLGSRREPFRDIFCGDATSNDLGIVGPGQGGNHQERRDANDGALAPLKSQDRVGSQGVDARMEHVQSGSRCSHWAVRYGEVRAFRCLPGSGCVGHQAPEVRLSLPERNPASTMAARGSPLNRQSRRSDVS